MKFKTIDDLELNGKRVLLRVDLNSDVQDGKVLESERLKAHAKTIAELKKKRAKVVVIAHQGSRGKKDLISLKKHSGFLNRYVKIGFARSTIGEKAISEIKKLKKGEALLLENVRFLKEEFNPDKNNKMVRVLKPYFDYYINDAFSVCHREQTSIVSFPEVLPSAIGRVMEEEVENIQKLKARMKNCLFVLGGAKPKDIVVLLNKGKVLAGGKFALLALIARGYNLGKENKNLRKQFDLIPRIIRNIRNIRIPIDLAVDMSGEREEYDLEFFPQKHNILDLGKDTIEAYKKEISKARAIFFKGAMGKFEEDGFEKGTKEILEAIANSKAFSVVGGGESSSAISKFKIPKKGFNYISLSGGALVHFIAGEKLPGLEALKK